MGLDSRMPRSSLVRDLPHTLAALSAGILNERRAELVVRGTSHLTPEQRSLVDAEVIGANVDPDDDMAPGGVASWGDREVERRVRACADHLDAAAAVERTRLAESQRRVSIRPVPEAMATVTALLPVAQAVAVHAALTQAALAGKAAGDERGKGQLMADTLVERVTGQAAADDVAVEVQVVIADHALVAGDETPAHVAGYGPVPFGVVPRPAHPPPRGAGWYRDAEGRTASTWLRRLYTHPATGTLVGMDSTRRLFPDGAAPLHRRPRRHLPHPVVRRSDRPGRPRHPHAAGGTDERAQRAGPLRPMQPRQGGARVECQGGPWLPAARSERIGRRPR